MFSAVESCRTKRANNRLVASSILAISYSFSPRPSSQSCSLVSHCTNSPYRLRRGRHWCTCLTFSFFARHSFPRINPLPHRLPAHLNAVFLPQILAGQRRTESLIYRCRQDPNRLLFRALCDLPLRWLAP